MKIKIKNIKFKNQQMLIKIKINNKTSCYKYNIHHLLILHIIIKVNSKETLVDDKDKELKKLRDIMKRQPGIEEEKMIPVYYESLKQKTKQMKAMQGEMTMYQSHLSEYKLEIDRLTKDF
jgi:hypothetical protein